MNGLSTLTQKGQVVIPQAIRKLLDLKPSTKLSFEVVGKKIIAEPVMTIDEAFGMIKSKKSFSKKDEKLAIERAVVKKFLKKQSDIS